ncbi:MAG TPA: transposase, partial [Actinocrinis sp.]
PGAERLTDQVARLIEFDVLVTDAQGRTRTSRIRVLTTLLDHEKYPAHELARLYAERWQVEITYLRLKSTLRGDGTVLRGRCVELVEQEIWALLVVYNLLCDLATAAAALDGVDPDEISFVAVLRLTRAKLGADLPCPHCHHHPDQPLETLVNAIAATPRNRTGTNRSRISPRTAEHRRTRHSTVGTYTITIVPSNLLTADEIS